MRNERQLPSSPLILLYKLLAELVLRYQLPIARLPSLATRAMELHKSDAMAEEKSLSPHQTLSRLFPLHLVVVIQED